MGIAGLWSSWKSPKGLVHSFTLLTITADSHDLLCQFHKSVDEKRMVVILPPDSYDLWLKATPQQSMDFMRPYPAQRLQVNAEAPAGRSKAGSLSIEREVNSNHEIFAHDGSGGGP
jgi:putative SOS response-associated peptidase YedK